MPFNPNPAGDFMFTLVPVLIVIGFIAFFGILIFSIVKGVGKWSYNNSQPVLTVSAEVVSKRTDISNSISNANDNMVHHSTYYATFQVESGDRMEFAVRGEEYGLLVEGDSGRLTFQGTRYLGFSREKL